ncbi:hypothetical protein G4G27_17880 [Sphingomonas sp. So64.6b]|uniref:hypothetical protein n=1 Tax=Sphingomonas sp. So64.6b TaxID=2997354 RepID=UPI0015FF5329|nr:hypothetical protein [Sphingomonas sp. So64.6b]QNA85645.1 hypothetical protein G4G27_17880 [Sphingomonas sp. So64.6b]
MKLFCAVLLGGIVASPVLAKEKEPPVRAQAFQRLVDCRTIKDSAARLACYDTEVATLDAAETSKDVVIVDKEQLRQAKRTLFGLSLPSIKLFGGDDDDAVAQIESKIASASEDVNGWTIRLVDGSVWRQIDSKPFYRLPKAGLDVVVKRAALGSYMLRVGGSPGVRVKRVI